MASHLWVDFNDVDEQGNVDTLVQFGAEWYDPQIGDEIVVGDDEGNIARGKVVAFGEAGLVAIALNPGTFSPSARRTAASA